MANVGGIASGAFSMCEPASVRWLTTLLARLVAFFLFSRLEVVGRHHLRPGRPILVVANHFNGLVDPVLLVAALGRTPRFLAKATLDRVLGVGVLLRAAGVIFVHRRQDGATPGDNVGAFADSHAALRDGDTVAIFPEGTTHDRPRLEPVRTGAARIALGARAAGAEGLLILPVGMTFADKVALRGEALVQIGDPIALDEVVEAGAGEEDAAAVRELTARIETSLRAVSPDFADVEEWLALDQAAEVAARRRDRPDPPLSLRADIARRLTRADESARAVVRSQMGRYATVLAGLQIDDRDVIAPIALRQLIGRAVRTGLLVVLLGSLVGATIAVNAIPVALVLLASLQVRRPATKGTVRALVGVVTFPAAWVVAATMAVDGAAAIAVVVLGLALGAVAAVLLLDRTLRLAADVLRWRLAHERVATLADAAAIRADVVDAVQAAVRTLR